MTKKRKRREACDSLMKPIWLTGKNTFTSSELVTSQFKLSTQDSSTSEKERILCFRPHKNLRIQSSESVSLLTLDQVME